MRSSFKNLRRRDFAFFSLLALAGFMTLYFLFYPRPCAGYESVLPVMISGGFFVALFLSNIIRLTIIRKETLRAQWLIVTGIVVVLLMLGWIIPTLRQLNTKGNVVLKAYTSKCRCGDLSTLTLLDNGHYVIKMAETEYVCRYAGLYRLRGDTLFLDEQIPAVTDSSYFPVYLIDIPDSLLYPVINGLPDTHNSLLLSMNRLDIRHESRGHITALQ